ncbi:D-alanyl-D-alanine carboxypeptidase [Streptomyces sp. TLI_053]|uniref:serine hydrolase domain-containing protein n=1 Tax=Streptomyces sp. TLI_053 TaxID=1855352 RepID=UPI00087C6263|nr:serine hydrolase domain-containing protein [Streptomyces sp. TLI_053]SDT83114.1 D-alanyl-D-alanine carboxypeptidase [Streptomyces sp. TLI_053]
MRVVEHRARARTAPARRGTALRVLALALAGAGVVGVTAPAAGALGTERAGWTGAASVGEARPGTDPEAAGGGPHRGDVDARALNEALAGVVGIGGASSSLARVTENGRTVWKGAEGVGDFPTGAAPSPNGRFRIASVTKTFVATVVLQLVGEGRFGLDDSVESLLPGAVPGGASVTVRQLLDHTSGLFDYTEDPAVGLDHETWLREGRWRSWTPRQLLAVANSHPPYFPPGTGWHYANTNYLLAGLIVARVTGHDWRREVEHRIIDRLGLTGTSMPVHATAIPGPHAHTYLDLPGGPVDVSEMEPSEMDAAGAGISTTADLATFLRALLGGRLLPAPLLTEMLTVAPASGGAQYGLGIHRLSTPCGDVWGNNGTTGRGHNSALYGTPDGRRLVAVSTNGYRSTGQGWQTSQRLLATAFCGRQSATAPDAASTD